MPVYPYDSCRHSLLNPGLADDFFQPGAIDSAAALCAEMARLAYVREEQGHISYLARAGFTRELVIAYGGSGTQVFIASQPGIWPITRPSSMSQQ